MNHQKKKTAAAELVRTRGKAGSTPFPATQGITGISNSVQFFSKLVPDYISYITCPTSFLKDRPSQVCFLLRKDDINNRGKVFNAQTIQL